MRGLRIFGGWLMRGHVPMLVARIVVGVVYIWLGVNKVVEPVAFLKALREYEILPLAPPQWMNLTAIVLPWIEIVCGILLVAGARLRVAGALLLGMTVAFTVALTERAFDELALTGLSLCDVRFDCGCGVGEVLFCSKFVENVGLIALAVIVVLSRSRLWALESVGAMRGRATPRGSRPR